MTGSLGGRTVTAPAEAEVFVGTVARNSVSPGIERKLSGKRIPSCGARDKNGFGIDSPKLADAVCLLFGGSTTATAFGAAQEANAAKLTTDKNRMRNNSVIEWR